MRFQTLLALLATASVFAGCISTPGASDVDAASAEGALESGLPETEVVDGEVTFSVATPARTLNNGGTFSHLVTHSANVSGYVVEVEWEAASPASESLSLWFRDAAAGAIPPSDPADFAMPAGPIAKADGPSVLRLAVPADMIPAEGDYVFIVRAAAEPAGAAVAQPFTMHVTTFAGVAFDEAYSALGEPAEDA